MTKSLIPLTLEDLDRYVAIYCKNVNDNAKREGWSLAETVAALATSEETTRKVFRRNGYRFPTRRKKKKS